jgi:hypothetical protein
LVLDGLLCQHLKIPLSKDTRKSYLLFFHNARNNKGLARPEPAWLSVNLSSVTHLDDMDDGSVILDGVDDSVPALPEPVLIPRGQFFATRRTRILSELSNAADDALPVGFSIDTFDFFDRRRFDEDVIFFHAFSGL